MWLLNAETRRLEHIVDDGQISSPYAILSHTWAEEEVCFDDIHQDYARQMVGYRKIDYTCTQAIKDEIKYVWIDTCCIDKRSSAELSEAINSMYRWYYNAYVCYAILSDVHAEGDDICETHNRAVFVRMQAELAQSRWFTRGWTLQELIAPRKVEFFDGNWNPLGVKAEVVGVLSEITKISAAVLKDRDQLSSSSIAQRMSWAAGRETSRPEDIAYALLGMFDVNMPLLYGEGGKAFMRLQDEIIRTRDADDRDHSILVWQSYAGDLLAPSPRAFSGGHQIASWTSPRDESFELTKKGLRLSLFARPDRDSNAAPAGPGDDTLSEMSLDTITVVLNCHYDDLPNHRIALKLRRRPQISTLGNNRRHDYHGDVVYDKVGDLTSVSTRELQNFRTMELTISRKPFTWPHMPLKLSVSLPSARIRSIWPETMFWAADGQLNYNRQGGILNSHVLEPNVGYGNLLIGKEEDEAAEWEDMILGIRIDRNTVPSRLFVGGSDENFSEAWVDSHPLHALRAGERREVHLDGDRVFHMEASYVLQDNELMWHLEVTRPASTISYSGTLTSSAGTDEVSRPRPRRGSSDEAPPVKALVKANNTDISDVIQRQAPSSQELSYNESLIYLQQELAQLRLEQWRLQQTALTDHRSFLERGMVKAELGLKSAFNKIFKRHEQSADENIPSMPPAAMELYGHGYERPEAVELPAETVPRMYYEMAAPPTTDVERALFSSAPQAVHTPSSARSSGGDDDGDTIDGESDRVTIGADADRDTIDVASVQTDDGMTTRSASPVFHATLSEALTEYEQRRKQKPQQNEDPASPDSSQATARSNSTSHGSLRRSVAIRRSSSPFGRRNRASTHKKGSLSLSVPPFGNDIDQSVGAPGETLSVPTQEGDPPSAEPNANGAEQQSPGTDISSIARMIPRPMNNWRLSAVHSASAPEGSHEVQRVSSAQTPNAFEGSGPPLSISNTPVTDSDPSGQTAFAGMSSGPIPEFLEDFQDEKGYLDATASEDSSQEARSPIFSDREQPAPGSDAQQSSLNDHVQVEPNSNKGIAEGKTDHNRSIEASVLSVPWNLQATELSKAAEDTDTDTDPPQQHDEDAGVGAEVDGVPDAVANYRATSLKEEARADLLQPSTSPHDSMDRSPSPLPSKSALEQNDDEDLSDGQLTPSPSLVHIPSDMWFDGEGSLGINFSGYGYGEDDAESDEEEEEEDEEAGVDDGSDDEIQNNATQDGKNHEHEVAEPLDNSSIPAPSRTPPALPPPPRDPPPLPLPASSER